VFRHRAFALYWFSRIASILVVPHAGGGVGWQLYELTGSAFDLGLLGLAQFGPMLVLTVFVGHVADRYDHRLILLLCQVHGRSGRRDPGLLRPRPGTLGTPVIYLVVAVVGSARAFEIPTMAAIISSLVPRGSCLRQWRGSPPPTRPGRSSARRSAACSTCSGRRRSMASPSFCGGWAGFMLALMRVEPRPRSTEPFSPVARCSAAFRFVRSDRIILGTLSLDMFACFLGGATALLPIFARDILLTGPWGLGLLRSAPAIGALDHVDHPGAPAADPADRPRAVQRADDLRPRGDRLLRSPPCCGCRWRRWP
jgi:hypothetical protein